jgi:hypothetical protein
LRNNYYKTPALIPEMPWLPKKPQPTVTSSSRF